ncbi:MAG: 5'-nucleotidase, lipoprotein e(P4) family, partial [Bacteroidota bacterium]
PFRTSMKKICSIPVLILAAVCAMTIWQGCKTPSPAEKQAVATPDGCSAPVVSSKQYFIQEHLVQSALWFQHSAEYRALAHQAFNLGRFHLDDIMKRSRFSKPPCVVVDIDETVLNNSPYTGFQVRCGQPFNMADWMSWTEKAEAEPIPGALEYLKWAKERGAETFYISNRSVAELDATIKNLKMHGFPYVDKAHVLLRDTVSTKKYRRAKVEETNTIVLLFGDNLGDLHEMFEGLNTAERNRKVEDNAKEFGPRYIVMPNPMYGGWEKAMRDGAKLNTAQKDSLRHAKLKSFR